MARASVPTHPAPAATPSGGLAWRTTGLCLIAAVLLAAVSIMPLRTFIEQTRSMDPASVTGQENRRRHNFVQGVLDAHHRGKMVLGALNLAYYQPETKLPIDRFAEGDRDNGLYSHLRLLSSLRQLPVSAASPDVLSRIEHELRLVAGAPPARLYQQAIQNRIETALVQRAGLRPREAAASALITATATLGSQHRPVVRELVDRLRQWANVFRQAGQWRRALLAETLAARLVVQMVEDSPTYDVALLGAEQLPGPLHRAAGDARRLGIESADDATTAADAAAQFALAWHTAYTGEVDMIPFSGGIPADIAAPAQRRLLRAFSAAGATIAAHGLLWAMFLVLGVVVLVNRRARQTPLQPRWRAADWVGALIVLTPLFLVLGVLAAGRVSFTWLFTTNSGAALLVFTPAWLVAVAMAGRIAVRWPAPMEAQRPPLWSVAVLMGAIVVLVVIGVLALSGSAGAGRPPPEVRMLRRLLSLTGIASGLTVVVWFIVGQVRRRRAGGPAGLAARSQLAVVTRALPLSAALLLACLWVDSREDRAHQQIYAAAARDPVADKLGADWQKHYFFSTAEVTQRFLQAALATPPAATHPTTAPVSGHTGQAP